MQAGPERALMQMWRAAIAAALPRACLAGHWPTAPEGRLVLIACGKAALPMAAEAVRHYGDNLAGIVIFPGDGQSEPRAPAPGLRLCPASHPVPDERSESAGRAALELASGLGEDDLLLLLLSGGGSSLMCLPAAGVSLGEKQSVTRALLACGASIGEINCVPLPALPFPTRRPGPTPGPCFNAMESRYRPPCGAFSIIRTPKNRGSPATTDATVSRSWPAA
jgi:hydroxypyruvate reductase